MTTGDWWVRYFYPDKVYKILPGDLILFDMLCPFLSSQGTNRIKLVQLEYTGCVSGTCFQVGTSRSTARRSAWSWGSADGWKTAREAQSWANCRGRNLTWKRCEFTWLDHSKKYNVMDIFIKYRLKTNLYLIVYLAVLSFYEYTDVVV